MQVVIFFLLSLVTILAGSYPPAKIPVPLPPARSTTKSDEVCLKIVGCNFLKIGQRANMRGLKLQPLEVQKTTVAL